MEQLISIFMSWQALLVGVVVFVLLGLVRKMGKKGLEGNSWWRAGLPIYPYALGLGLCLVPGVPIPAELTTWAAKAMFGLYCGWLSGFSFQLIRSVLTRGGVLEGKKSPPKEE